MIELANKELCSGCGACANRCTQNCIKMIPDKEGFLFPIIDRSHCSQCGICVKTCPVIGEREVHDNNFKKFCYAANAKDIRIRLRSSSGGVFAILASQMLSSGGIVYGAALTEGLSRVKHIRVFDINQLTELQGSKYLQSEIGNIYKSVETDLNNGKKVLFSGTACEISGLKAFLGKEYPGLYCIDFICHGVPSQLLWEKYLACLKKKYGSIKNVSFRYKKCGQIESGMDCKNKEKKIYDSRESNPYLIMFLKDYCLRKSCYNCKFKGFDRDADITLGDFWGIDEFAPELNDGKGSSIVLIHNQKGKTLFDRIADEVVVKEVDYVSVFTAHNDSMLKSAERPEERNQFFDDLNRLPFEKIRCKYAPLGVKLRVKVIFERIGLLQVIRKIRGRKQNFCGEYGMCIFK